MKKRCLFEKDAGAPGDQTFSLPCADGIAPRERKRKKQPTVKSNYRMQSTKDI